MGMWVFVLDKIVIVVFLIVCTILSTSGCTHIGASIVKPISLAVDPVVASFTPDFFIDVQIPEDIQLHGRMRQLFSDANRSLQRCNEVYMRAVRQFGAQEVMLLTHDAVRVSAFYFKRNDAPINIIYVSGYFFDLTPTKEWAVPFALMFPKYNILSFDWRGIGKSDGWTGWCGKNSFGADAYPDIQAAINFLKKENNKPIVVVGFCFGAAMALYATIQAQKNKQHMADALVLNCVFATFEKLFDRAILAENRTIYKFFLSSGIARWWIDHAMHGSLFDVNPIELVKDIKIPCYFEHYSFDPFVPLADGVSVYKTATCPKMFMQSDLGRHAQIHSKVPYQCRKAFNTFLRRFNLLPVTWLDQAPAGA